MEAEQNEINPKYLLPGTMVGPWEIVHLLGEGGCGVAYKVRRDGRYYALKLTLFSAAKFSPDERERHETRVRRECGILLGLNHPNIVRVHAFERWPDLNDGYLYIVMDLVNGQNLYTWREKSVPSLRRICHVFQRGALGLAEAHARGAFHRDVKSDNFIVGIDGEPVWIDWGIARSRSAVTLTQDHAIVGTPAYLPPEYCRYVDFDEGAENFVWTPQSELHSLGYMFYEVLTGQSPFNLPDEKATKDESVIVQRLARTTQAIKSITPTLPSLINSKVPAALDRIVMKLLEKNPADRYATGTELSQALDQALAEADTAWDAPFDMPPTLSPAVPPKEGPAHAAPNSEAEILPALAEADPPATAALPGAEPLAKKNTSGSPSRFRAPTVELKSFEPPEEASDSKPAAAVAPIDPVQVAREQLARRLKSPSHMSRAKALLAVGFVAVLLAGGALLFSKKPAAAAPESLLRKVERASATNAPLAAAKPGVDETASSGLPPLPTPTAPARSETVAPHEPLAQPDRLVAPPAAQQHARTTAPSEIVPSARVARAAARQAVKAPIREENSSLEFGQRLGGDVATSNAKGPARYRVQTGARIRASLDLNLDSRTASAGPAAVRLRRAYISEGHVVFPAGTMAYGDARASGGRFTVRFTRLVFPNKTEVSFEGLAYDIQDRKPGLAPARRIAAAQAQDGTGAKVGRAVANTMLTAVNGGLAQDAAHNAAETALNSRDSEESASGGEALLLDAGAEMDVLVTKPF